MSEVVGEDKKCEEWTKEWRKHRAGWAEVCHQTYLRRKRPQRSQRSGMNLKYRDRLDILITSLKRGYKEDDIFEAVIRAINPGLRLRSYLEGKPVLGLARLRKILRSHYQKKWATEIYQLLSSAAQEAGEIPQDFLFRLLDQRQNVLCIPRSRIWLKVWP